MTHIEQLHLDAIYGSILAGPKAITAAEAAAEITENIACEFMDWYWDKFVFYDSKNKLHGIMQSSSEALATLTIKELFQEYLKTKENDTPNN